MKPHDLFSLLFIVVLFVSTGCGKRGLDVHIVEGVVTLDGAPFEGVTVSLIPTEPMGNRGYAVTDAEGCYRISTHGGADLQGTTLGTYQVALNKFLTEIVAGTVTAESDGVYKTENLVPTKYQSHRTSGFEITVREGKNEYNFELLSR